MDGMIELAVWATVATMHLGAGVASYIAARRLSADYMLRAAGGGSVRPGRSDDAAKPASLPAQGDYSQAGGRPAHGRPDGGLGTGHQRPAAWPDYAGATRPLRGD